MGTRATTRIEKNGDFIEVYTRWDGFSSEIKNNLKKNTDRYKESITLLRSKNSESEKVKSWIDKLESLVNDCEKNPSIESVTVLLCMMSFVHHHVLPTNTSEDSFEYFGKHTPDLTASIVDGKFLFKKAGSKKSIKELDKEFKVLRIKSLSSDANEYVDIKVKEIDGESLYKHIIKLPFFWRDFYNDFKLTSEEERKKIGDSYVLSMPIFRLQNRLKSFYNPTEKYKSLTRDTSLGEIPSEDLYKKVLRERLEEIEALIPFDFSVRAMATHLFVTLPSLVVPMTNAELNSNYKIDYEILISDDRLNRVFVGNKNWDYVKTKHFFDKLINEINLEENDFYTKNDIKIKPSIEFNLLQKDGAFYIIYPYEKNLVKLMMSQYEIEFNEMSLSKKNKP